MHRPTLRQIEYFVVLSECSAFREAAARLHVTQPTLSGQIADLEDRLGTRLFERGRFGVRLSADGVALLPRARQLLIDLSDFCSAAKSMPNIFAGTIRIGVPTSLGPYLLPRLVPELHRRWPKMKLYVREDVPAALEQELMEGRYDLLLNSLDGDSHRFEIESLFHEPLLIGLARDHPLALKETLYAADLKGSAILALGPSHRFHDQVERLCRRLKAHLLTDYEGTSLDTLRQMVGMGMGLSFFPHFYVQSEMLGDPAIIVRQITDMPISREIGLLWRKNAPGAEAYRMLGGLILKLSGLNPTQ
ncbi:MULTISPECIES: hydrogen peroxide-inducible genes activator [unclassified Iodidimonas]|jgi:LysR family hydrogen peroxide-inducible transcriptional activator|uniref:hydrogen peroxide-inducible genes activator n=1 Tax=unclassified Iodidimonas TaxID=2626145 RepID=UPI002482B484|nr:MULTISPECIES: hydrogen peroxide-inducible genes activator [unclassified Iodidimonas]